jgi:hypothetical protein
MESLFFLHLQIRYTTWYAEGNDNVSFAIVLSERGGVWKLDAATQSTLEDDETGKDNEAGKDNDSAAEKNPYNLDYESTEMQPMSDKKASAETLRETAVEWLEERINRGEIEYADYTYEDVAEHIGVDASIYYYSDHEVERWSGRVYAWYAEDDNTVFFSILLTESDGDWKLAESTFFD